jgi:hypothetical protein
MIIRKNISLNEEYIQKLEPLMKKHNGNLSAVIREIIDLADAAVADPDSVKRLISGLRNEQNLTSSALIWAMKNLAGRLPDEETVRNIFGDNISSMSDFEKCLNELAGEIYWDSAVKIVSDNDRQPKNATFSITGKNPDMNRFLAAIIAVFVAEKFNLGISNVKNINTTFEMKMKYGEKEWALKSVAGNFGYMDDIHYELYKKPDFWNTVILLYAKMNYNMVAISKQLFEESLGENYHPRISTIFEQFFGCPINQVPQEELSEKIKILFKSLGLIEDIDVKNDSLIIYHGFNNPEAIKKLANMFVELLNLTGSTYNFTSSEKLIVIKRLPEVSRILIKIVEDFKEKPFSNYATEFHKMLDILKNMPSNEEFVKSLGWKFGKKIIQNYESDKRLERWDTNTFVKYMQDMGPIFAQDLKWTIISENVIHGKIISCPLVKADAAFNNMNCTFIKGILDEWISHSLGERTERVHTAAYGNNCCEIYVALSND